MKKMGATGGRKKIELSLSSDTSFSFRGVDSLCSSDGDSSRNRTSMMSIDSNSNVSSDCKPFVKLCLSDDFIEFTLNSDCRERESAETPRRDAVEDLNFKCDEVVGPLTGGNNLLEREMVLTFQKSHSAKMEMTYSPSQSESDHSSSASSKARFSTIRKMFDPFMKAKSLRSTLSYAVQPKSVKTIGTENVRTERAFRKSLLHDFSHTAQNSECNVQFVNKDQHRAVVAHSPVHLHGLLKLGHKQGVPFFEFCLNCPEDVIVARTWQADSAFNWVYTFHSVDGRKKSNVGGGRYIPSMVGLMQVSCYLWSELKDGGVFDNSVVTEFVLYDLTHAGQRAIAQEFLKCSTNAIPPKGCNPGFLEGNHELDNGSDSVKFKEQAKDASSNKSNPCPLASGDLHPNLEIASIVIKAPFEKRESLKYKRGNKISDKMHSSLLNFSMVEKRGKDHLESKSSVELMVVIPTSNHGLPFAESRGPSSLLDRWRLGGGCDCGGWDMGCPLIVFSNPNVQCAKDKPLLNNQQPLVELFVQGEKENTPGLTIICLEEGKYAVDFHAQLSTLQAFSICVAILHGSEASIAAGHQRNMQVPHSNSLKMYIEEEVKFLIDAVTEEEKNLTKRVEDLPRSYGINPPFSPIAGVLESIDPTGLFCKS